MGSDPQAVHVGRVTAVYWGDDGAVATMLAELADAARSWPGIRTPPERPVRLLVVRDQGRFDSLTSGRVPEWGAAVAYPASNTILLKVGGDPRLVRRALRHELAHLALHELVPRVPRWFDEGYASRAAGDWDAADALGVNWAMLRGERPTLLDLDRQLRGPYAADAKVAYAFAATAVRLLERYGGERGLEPLLSKLAVEHDFDRALRTTHFITLGQFEVLWQRDVRSRYGWLVLASSVTVFWAMAALILVALWSRRRARDRLRRVELEQSWAESAEPSSPDA